MDSAQNLRINIETTRYNEKQPLAYKGILDYFGHIAQKEDGNLENIVITLQWTERDFEGGAQSDQVCTKVDNHRYVDNTLYIVEKNVISGRGHDPQ